MHPSQVLFPGAQQPVSLPVCDHYAGSEKLMRKSMALQQELGPVFDITFDCEDGAAAGNEAAHAQLVAALVNSPDNLHGRIGARVHDVGNAHFEQDIAIICGQAARRLAFVMLPKAGGVNDVLHALESVNRTCLAAGRHALPLQVLIETHGALTDVWKIAALPQVESLSFGVMDFVSAHHGAIPATAMRSPGQFDHPLVRRAKLEIAAACHLHGKVASHNVTTDINDTTTVADDARRAAQEFGYTRMWSIHPGQIRPIVQAMSPSAEEADQAARILLKAAAVQWGPIEHLGNLHDRASYRYYWCILQRAHASGVALPTQAASWFADDASTTTTMQ
ncbi:HpcH/HpaI aldolase/citrate lyase family protein [Herbaspirillum sp. alder98]|uniref:HpcH/HpaI aldolase/citrate lyase family protein n=1 Tax=Herbaspirillum sp. alder98 TaxID=2913096 RepID=UPI001CD8A1B0|nr:aldolase/citrate lyase family protein [Herbaspirillum sp. alder98]MCA1325955.1 CoA ester lyase [Herbaspirillum sp. alder98]